ncbi:MAG: transcriptional regulator [Candidatus Hermodarchaeota archaeon]
MTKARTRLIQEVTANLEDAGFDISTQCDVRPSCFDMAARRGDQLVLIKMLGNIDAFTQEDAMALQLVAQFFNAVPLIVGKKTRRGILDDGVVYRRHGVPTVAPHSFQSLILQEEQPKEFIQRGGRFVAIDGAKLKEVRLFRNMTQEELAGCIQVSARAILAYEKDEMDVSTDVAERLERELETDLVIPIDLLTEATIRKDLPHGGTSPDMPYLTQRVNDFFEKLGMTVWWTDRAPFHAVASEKGPPLMSGVGSLRSWTLQKRMEIMKSVSDVTESDAVVIVEEGQTDECVSEVPVIRQLELDDIEKPRELKKIIEERSEK